MYKPIATSAFKRDLKRSKKRGKDILHIQTVIKQLATGKSLPPRYKDHLLTGNWKGRRECHIEPDWLLIYRIDDEDQEIILERTGSHADLF